MPISHSVLSSLRRGLLDSVAFHRCLVLLVKSSKMRIRLMQCLCLNGLLILGSIIFFNFVLSPLLALGFRITAGYVGLSGEPHEVLKLWAEWMYYALWITPIYLVSFILNTFWYRDIALEAMAVYPMGVGSRSSSTATTGSFPGQIADMLLRLIFNFVFLVYLALLVRWRWIYVINLSFMISFNAFEYKLGHMSFHQKVKYIEKHWLYFLNFSLWVSILVAQFPAMVENGLLAVLFPLLLMSASTSGKPVSISAVSRNQHMLVQWLLSWVEELPVFFIVEKTTDIVVKLIDFFHSRK